MASSLAFVVLFRSLRASGGLRTGSTGAVGPVGRLRCDARVGVAPPNSRRNAGPSQVSSSPSGGRTRFAWPWGHHDSSPSVRCAQTAAASQFTKRAARADPNAALLAAPHSPAHRPPLARGPWSAEMQRLARARRFGHGTHPFRYRCTQVYVDRSTVSAASCCQVGKQIGAIPLRRRVGWGQVVAPVGPADRAPQGSRPGGPTESVGRRRLSPSDEKQRRICIAHSTVARII